jgi:hypothetical protein
MGSLNLLVEVSSAVEGCVAVIGVWNLLIEINPAVEECAAGPDITIPSADMSEFLVTGRVAGLDFIKPSCRHESTGRGRCGRTWLYRTSLIIQVLPYCGLRQDLALLDLLADMSPAVEGGAAGLALVAATPQVEGEVRAEGKALGPERKWLLCIVQMDNGSSMLARALLAGKYTCQWRGSWT